MQIGKVPAHVDIGAQFSCIRADIAEIAYSMGEPCRFESCSVICSLADGRECRVTDAVKLHVKLLSFSWDHEFKVLKGGSFPVILGLDFLERTKMVMDVASRKFSFAFAPDVVGAFGVPQEGGDGDSYLLELLREAVRLSTLSEDPSGEGGSRYVLAEFPALFSRTLGTATCPPYDIEVSDSTPVRFPPYRCAPPKIAIFRKIINELLEQGVIRASKSRYASPAFLIPKSGLRFP